MVFAELQRPDTTPAKEVVHTMLRQYGERVSHLLCRGIEQGSIAPSLNVAAASVMFIGMVQGLVMQSLITGNNTIMLTNTKPMFQLYVKAIQKSEL